MAPPNNHPFRGYDFMTFLLSCLQCYEFGRQMMTLCYCWLYVDAASAAVDVNDNAAVITCY